MWKAASMRRSPTPVAKSLMLPPDMAAPEDTIDGFEFGLDETASATYAYPKRWTNP